MRRLLFALRLLVLSLVVLPLIGYASRPVLLSGMVIKPSQTVSHITFILNKKTYGRVKYLPQAHRLTVEFANTYKPNTYKYFVTQGANLTGSNIKKIRTKQASNGVLRFIFQVHGKIKWTIYFLANDENNEARLQLDIFSGNATVVQRTAPSALRQLKKTFQNDVLQALDNVSVETDNPAGNKNLPSNSVLPSPSAPPVLPHTKSENLAFAKKAVVSQDSTSTPNHALATPPIFTVAIDPGHGGKDSGARGAMGVEEKNVVLSIAKKLAEEINQQPYMHAVLTRDGDYFVPLRDRLKFARKGKADIFIAIHADAYFNSIASGASVYALSQRGATSEAARWLAHRDNYSELGDIELNSLSDNDPILRSVMVDLAQTATIQDSIRLGNKVLDALDTISSLHYRNVERAPFVVLKSPDIPSILVETGFISNALEEQRLNEPKYQQKIAHSLWQGINMYVRQYADKGE